MIKMNIGPIVEQDFETPVTIAANEASQLEPGEESLVYDPQEGLFSSAVVRVVKTPEQIRYYVDNTSLLRKWIGTPDYIVQTKRKTRNPRY